MEPMRNNLSKELPDMQDDDLPGDIVTNPILVDNNGDLCLYRGNDYGFNLSWLFTWGILVGIQIAYILDTEEKEESNA